MGVLIIWIIFAIVVSIIASTKGRSGIGWFFISCIISPLISLIILFIVGDSDDKKIEELQETKKIDKSNVTTACNTDQAIEDLNRYKNLLQLGAISQEEFDTKKEELMPLLRRDFAKADVIRKEQTEEPHENTYLEEKPLVASMKILKESKLDSYYKAHKSTFLLIIIAALILLLLAIGGAFVYSDYKKEKSMHPTPTVIHPQIDNPNIDFSALEAEKTAITEADKKVINQFIALYTELIGFKNKQEFIDIGFKSNGKYYKWLQKAREFNTDANAKSLIKLRVVPHDLEGLAMEYVSSKGKESEATQLFRGSIEAAIRQYKDITQETKISTTTAKPKQAENSSTEISLGKWKLTIPGINGQIIVEIFKKGNSYYCIENGKHKKLRREGDRYYVVGNEWGEYYRIIRGDLKMGDRQGDIPNNSGWKITKLK